MHNALMSKVHFLFFILFLFLSLTTVKILRFEFQMFWYKTFMV